MKILVSSITLSEGALEMGTKLKEIFDEAKKDQMSKLFACFGAIATHLVNPSMSMSQGFLAIGLDKPPDELAPFFNGKDLLPDAKAALESLAIIDNADPDSWGSFMEFCRENFC